MASDFVPVASGEPDVAAPRAGGLVSDVGVADGPPGALYVWQGEYPWDVRVEKVVRALTDAGYDTRLVARNGDLARALERMTDPRVRAAVGEAARRAVRSRYNWERDSAVLLEVVDSLARRRSGVPLGRRRA